MERKWWHKTIGYQIYPKSFQDTNGDGVGDLQGVISHLDDLKDLGINVIWLCPVNCSPMKDHGYDISDYDEIDPVFGCKDDMKELIREAGWRGIKVLMDLVVNHTSTEHPWFQKALKDPEGEYGNYYIIQKGRDGKAPNNWRAVFGGSAWEKIEGTDFYYLHLFTKWQPDLNWENPALRQKIYGMVNRWLEMGVSGFRVDAISHLKKNLVAGELPPDGEDGLANGFSYFRNAEGIDFFLNELKERTFALHDAMTIGEVDDIDADKLEDFIGEDGYFSTIFDFSHREFNVASEKWRDRPVEMIDEMKRNLFAGQNMAKGRGLFINYLENHDSPRAVERLIPEKEIDFYSSSMVCGINFFLPGPVFLYQGQAIGMTNCPKKKIGAFKDQTTFDNYERYLGEGMTEQEALARINMETREHARTPVQWNGEKHAGFSKGTPWFAVNENYKTINLAAQKKEPDSLYSFYKKMIAFRKSDEFQDLFLYGEMLPMYGEEPGVIGYERSLGKRKVLVINNAKSEEAVLPLPGKVKKVLLSNYKDAVLTEGTIRMHRYQMMVLELSC